jgi:hypothetical protein
VHGGGELSYMVSLEGTQLSAATLLWFLQKVSDTTTAISKGCSAGLSPTLRALNVSGCSLPRDFPAYNKPTPIANAANESDVGSDGGVFCIHPLLYLNISANSIQHMSALSAVLPKSLLVLDLSFSENLTLEPGCFLQCPQLLRLILDGCGIKRTHHRIHTMHASSTGTPMRQCYQAPPREEVQRLLDLEDGDDNGNDRKFEQSTGGSTTSFEASVNFNRSSIFAGLVCLRELSLKENDLETAGSLLGLTWFGLASLPRYISSSNSPYSEQLQKVLPATLEKLWVNDNPIADSETQMREATKILAEDVPSLTHINDKDIRIGADGRGQKFDVLKIRGTRRIDADDSSMAALLGSTGEGKGLDSMEQEYLAALKGEKDVSVVS